MSPGAPVMFRRALAVLPAVLSLLLLTLPAASADEAGFADTVGTGHEDAVFALASRDIVRGCEDDRFCSRDELTRAQGATIVASALELTLENDAKPGRFVDTTDSVHRDAIEAVAEAGLVVGCDDDHFCPQESITREQLATILKAAFDVPDAPEGVTYFVDVRGMHAPAVASITEAGIANGCDLVSFCSTDNLQRAHAAMFFARALGLVDRVEVAPFAEREAEYNEQLAAAEAAAKVKAEEEAAAKAEEEAAAKAEAEANAPGAKAVEVALAQVGKPYVWGGSGPNSFDCSGLTSYAWAAAGVQLPRTSRDQYSGTTRISRSELRPGDLIFYYSPIGHVAMYIGDGRVVEAPYSGNNVRVRSDGLTRSGIVGYGRP